MANNIYAVVEFIEEQLVEIVATCWIETIDCELYCYWPRNNASHKLRKLEIPDKETWIAYKVRVFSYTDSVAKAQKILKRAEETSNVESDSDSGHARKRRRTKASLFEYSEGSDSDEDILKNGKKKSLRSSFPVITPLLPVAPSFSSNPSNEMSLPMAQRKEIFSALSNPLTDASRTSLSSGVQNVHGSQTEAIFYQTAVGTPEGNRNLCERNQHYSSGATTDSFETPKSGNRNSLHQDHDSFQRSVLTKLDIMLEKQEEALSILRVVLGATRGVSGNEMLEDIIPNPLDSVEELENLNDRLADEDARKKMLQFFLALCGHNHGFSTRRILAKVGTNKLWSLYSLKRRKAKRAFKELAVSKIVIKACLRVHKGVSEIDIEEQIAEYLKHDPQKSGGSRYKDRRNQEQGSA
ncbi:uncharacterized protein LOC114541386 isoform X1 [Dendronephthya gigantea]|uniref:uncharacterized protein LOC114541386 isoform X1 n=1 Tax=Dendronephthya gigantea TaxID=151771 RepID=UPI00106B8F93|nr:uncharacterized protein LOC114541386 isoform X1 [Dendronephthya gigantea]